MNGHVLLLSGNSPDVGPIAAQTPFFERDWSRAWANFLVQEIGPYTEISPEALDFKKLSPESFLYLPQSSAAHLSGLNGTSFKGFVEAGGTLILEGPAANGFDFSGVSFSPRRRPLKKISGLGRKNWPAFVNERLPQMPFETRGWEIERKTDKAEVLLEMEGTPVLFRQAVGKGWVFVLGFDFGLLLTALQQGVPAREGRRLEKLFGKIHRVKEPEDLVLKAALLTSEIPWADFFERFLFKVFTAGRPVPRWWYFPGVDTGCVISTHDEEALGSDPRIEAMFAEEKSRGIEGTLFVISDEKLKQRWQGNGLLRKWGEGGRDIGIHWNRFEKPRAKFRRFKWGMHETPLALQKTFLERELGRPISINRNHYLALGETYGEHFERLAAEGMRFDSTYGPNQGGRGYLFGTGYPFYGLTWEGASSGVLELPFLMQETWGGADLDFLKRLLKESDENFHQVVTMNFHPHYTVLQEEGRAAWLGALSAAKERGQWTPSLGKFFEFFAARMASPFQSRWEDGRLEIRMNSPKPGLTLCLPRRIEGKGFTKASIDGNPAQSRGILNFGFEEILIPLPPGTGRVEVHYER